jgi:malate dehydrogenase (oxaloacetate-decarboxylating)
VLGYPGIFRGALEVGAVGINVEMKLAAADAIAELATDGELVPNALDKGVHEAVAEAVKGAAVRSGIARPERRPTGSERGLSLGWSVRPIT